jgi:hypothetical protein
VRSVLRTTLNRGSRISSRSIFVRSSIISSSAPGKGRKSRAWFISSFLGLYSGGKISKLELLASSKHVKRKIK